MLRYLFCFFLFSPTLLLGIAGIPLDKSPKSPTAIYFTENKGQISNYEFIPSPEVLFSGCTKEMSFFLRHSGLSYQFYKINSWKKTQETKELIVKDKKLVPKEKLVPNQMTVCRLDVNWINCNTNVDAVGENPIDGYDNYYTGANTDGILNVRSFKKVTYKHIYSGIDLVWYEKKGCLKYDYLVKAGANYEQIRLRIVGAQKISLDDSGELVLKTPIGEIIEHAPIVLQGNNELKARWIINDTVVSFRIEDLNPKEALVIDPGVRTWGTYYGGGWNEYGTWCTTDNRGGVYFSGNAQYYTTNIIATPGAFQVTAANRSAYLVKFNSIGQRKWGTYYGMDSEGLGCAADPNGNVYLSGVTSSSTNIATPGSHQTTFEGQTDAFLAKFDSMGVRLWGTFYGGNNHDRGISCATDASGYVYLAGDSHSSTHIAFNGQQMGFGGGNYDAFLVKFNSQGQRQWGTYYGGPDTEEGYCCAADATGNVYLTGYTGNTTHTNIASPGSHQSTTNGDAAFLVKFNAVGQRLWGTYYGGTNVSSGYACASDAGGNVYLAGLTGSNTINSISTATGHQPNWGGGTGVWDGFLVKFNSAGIRQWGTYYGGHGTDVARACAIDVNDNVYITGYTDTNTGSVIATMGTQQTSHGGNSDAFLTSFGPDGQRHWGTYFGGPGRDHGFGCALDDKGRIYVCGLADYDVGNLLATPGSHQTVFGGREDAILVQFNNCIIPSPNNAQPNLSVSASSNSLCSGQNISLNVLGAQSYTWMPGSTNTTSLSFTATSDINYTVVGQDNQGCKNSAEIHIPVTPTPTLNATPFFYLCSGSASLNATGAEHFAWFPGNLTGGTAVVSPSATTNYTVIGSNKNCVSSAVCVVSLGIAPPFHIKSSNESGCNGSCFTFTNNSDLFHPYTYFWGDTSTVSSMIASHCYTQPGEYLVTAQALYTTGCHVTSEDTLKLTIFPRPTPNVVVNQGNPLNVNSPIVFNNFSSGAQKFEWSFGDLSDQTVQLSTTDVVHIYTLSGNYCLKLVAEDTLTGCSDSLTKCVDVLCPAEITIPNVFTPNNDGINDLFNFKTSCIRSLNFVVFNRWGTQIGFWRGIDSYWDGKSDLGIPASDGTYVFVLEYIDENNSLIKKSGTILLVR